MLHENNFFNAPSVTKKNNMVSVESDKAIAEIQSAMVIAKKFPRDERAALDRILTACMRPTLAETSQYQYSKGGTDISGPSIRMAESLAQNWGNIQYGIKEVSQENGSSTVQSYAWDIETNTRREIVFQVPHIRHTKKGAYPITDPREVYELVANQGARRLRACILGLIPGDVQDAAINQCNITLNTSCDMSSDAVAKMISGFSSIGVSKSAIEKKLQRRIDAITPAQMVTMKKIYNSIRDGMSSPNDWFEADSDSSDNVEALEAALSAIESAASKAEIDGVLSLIDALSSNDMKIARSKWMEKVESLKKAKTNKPEKETTPTNINWGRSIKECGDTETLTRLLVDMPESDQLKHHDLIDGQLDSFR
ncbi:MAG: hypothetical protein M0Q44_01115 [Methylobacter sp.]|jgi:hypothetical protein|nr:hypothetical protein [Methylobacter sp.]